MNLSRLYRRGILIVLATLTGSAFLVLMATGLAPAQRRAAEDLGGQTEPLGAFQLVERSGRPVTEADLSDRVGIVSFIFTRCPLQCPKITSIMKSLEGKLAGTDVLLVSLSVDPEHDTPEVLDDYAKRFEADPRRWWFVTGDREKIYDLIQTRFKLSVMVDPNPVPTADGKVETIVHSSRLGLVDRGRIVGLFDSNDPAAVEALITRARRRSSAAWLKALPAVNASLNGLCALFLLAGWSIIRRRDMPASLEIPASGPVPSILQAPATRGHVFCMIVAVTTSVIFLACYLVYHYHAGSVAFQGSGLTRWIYLSILLSHTLLATFGVVPLVLTTLYRALRGHFAAHARAAAVTFPIWLYVSVTGVLIYLMLYHLSAASAMGQS
jgi:protein SCO1/2/putative membrane protein